MTVHQARRILADSSQPLTALTEAAAAIDASGQANEDDLKACARLGGLPAELVQSRYPTHSRAVVILEDDPRRIEAMVRKMDDVLPGYPPKVFVDSSRMIEWLRNHQPEVDLISLDHDLNDYDDAGGAKQAAGTGRHVADFLKSQLPTCPIIIHSSNAVAALGMSEELQSAGWPISRVYPHDDLAWIENDWADEIVRLRQKGWRFDGSQSETRHTSDSRH